MARFSLGGGGNEGPSHPKRRRIEDQTHEDGEEENYEEEFAEEDDEEVGEDKEEIEARENGGGYQEPSRRLTGQRSSVGSSVLQKFDRDDCISVILTDPDVFDCPICFEQLSAPVFQCENGHIACSSCCVKLGNVCASCFSPIGYNRCRAIEKVLNSIKISCQYLEYGCRETLRSSEKYDHEKACIYAPCSCPFPGCKFIHSLEQLSQHFHSKHLASLGFFFYNCSFHIVLKRNDRLIVLQEQDKGELFILRNCMETLGNVLTLTSIHPNSTKGRFFYDLTVGSRGSSLRLQSTTQSTPSLVESLPSSTGFLLVPSCFLIPLGQMDLDLCIHQKDESSAGIIRVNRAGLLT